MKGIFKSLSFFRKWFRFIQQNGPYILFIALFYSIEICYYYIQNYDLALHRFPERMIGIATLKDIDIARRASLFYHSIFVFFAVNAAFYLLAFLFARKKQCTLKELGIINISAVAGCLLLFLSVFKLTGTDSIHLIILIHLIALIFLAVKRLLLNDLHKKLFDPALFSMILCVSICFFFLSKECTSLFHFNLTIHFSIFILIFSSITLSVLALYIRRLDYSVAMLALIKLSWVFIPIMLLPLYTVLKNEIYLILNNKGILYFSPLKLYVLQLFFTLIWIFARSRKPVERLKHLSPYKILSNNYFPLLILGITAYLYYNPFLTVDSKETFEGANRFLPVMEFLKFHTVPFLEKFNSHMLSETFTIFLYALFNKLTGLQPLIYDFMIPVGAACITYFIIKDFTHNSYVALFTVVLFPLVKDLTVTFFPVILAVYVLYKIIYRPPSFKNYLLLLCTCLFLIIWKIDIGIAGDISIMTVLTIYAFSKTIQLNIRLFLTALAVFFAGVLLLYFLFLLKGINPVSALLNEYNYLSSAQSYGYTGLSNTNPDKVFQMQYFIFPVAALLLGIYIIFHFKNLRTSKNSKFATICLLFCIVFYVANFQRGLIRHSFIEDTDVFLSSFIFFILGGSVYLLCIRRSQLVKFLLFFFASFFLITGFKYPECDPYVVYESMHSKLNSFSQIQPQPHINREIDSSGQQDSFEEFQNFVSKELKTDETFIDFSNEPMLYYYTKKITPSYFYQNPDNLHNDYLQQTFIENLPNYKAPLLIFETTFPPGAWFWDNPDGIPNPLRHYRIAEYLYQQYEPFAIMENLCLWKRKNWSLKNDIKRLFTLKNGSSSATFTDSSFRSIPIDSITTSSEGTIFITISYTGNPHKRSGLIYCKNPDSNVHSIEPLFSDTDSHKIYYSLKHRDGEKIKLYLNHFKNVSGMEVDEVKYVPDVYSLIPQHWDLAMLPYIWSNYDKKMASAALQNIIANTDTLISKSKISFSLPGNIDKSTGNYIYISLDAINEKPIPVQLSYGPSNGTMDFILPPGVGTRTFAVRISSQYNWYAKENTKISLYAPGSENVYLKKITLLKGD